MTPKQAKLLNFIAIYQQRHKGASPSYSEMRNATGCRNRGRVADMIARLKARGYIEHRPHAHRQLRILTPGEIGGNAVIFGCFSCLQNQAGRWRGEVKTSELHTLTVTPDGAPRPLCRLCGNALTQVKFAPDVSRTVPHDHGAHHAP
jgi:SOS-response transcriptional repressor LexA